MPEWFPQPVWKDKDCFIIGGGPSLRNFNFSLLEDERVIGCNYAYTLGPKVCDYIIFGDKTFLLRTDEIVRRNVYEALSRFPNPVVTTHPDLLLRTEPWLKVVRRKDVGFHRTAIGYNSCTGAQAINLALLLGATTIYLLGFDMSLGKGGRANWHDLQHDNTTEKVYVKMVHAFENAENSLERNWPEVHVYNVTKKSKLNMFTTIDFTSLWDSYETSETVLA